MHEMIIYGWDKLVEEKLHFPSIRAYLIQRYLLEGRGNSYLQKELGGISKYRVIQLLKASGLVTRGARTQFLNEKERKHWEAELAAEKKKQQAGSFLSDFREEKRV
jgi:hypothetical protein